MLALLLAAPLPPDAPPDPPPDPVSGPPRPRPSLGPLLSDPLPVGRSRLSLRNVVTHPSRETPDIYTAAAWSEASSCAREFLLLSILHLLDYNDRCRSYTDPVKDMGRTLSVTWAAKSEELGT